MSTYKSYLGPYTLREPQGDKDINKSSFKISDIGVSLPYIPDEVTCLDRVHSYPYPNHDLISIDHRSTDLRSCKKGRQS